LRWVCEQLKQDAWERLYERVKRQTAYEFYLMGMALVWGDEEDETDDQDWEVIEDGESENSSAKSNSTD